MSDISLAAASNLLQVEDLATFSGGMAGVLNGTDDNFGIGTNREKADEIALLFINLDAAPTDLTITAIDKSNQGELNNRALGTLAAASMGICWLNLWESDLQDVGKVEITATNTTSLKLIPLYLKNASRR